MVITLDKRKDPVGFTTERRARILIERGEACVHRYYPYTIILKNADAKKMEIKDTYRIKIDPGAKDTGIAVIREQDNSVMLYLQVEHRGDAVRSNLETRFGARHNRRQRETWYRKCKWPNHYLKKGSKYKFDSPRPAGWLPPSVKSTADNVINWVKKLKKLINITSCSFEAVRFDTQLMDNPDISGEEYQHGTLYGYELKEYLLDKYGHQCQYCGGKSGDDKLEWEHMVPASRGGSNSVKNANLACSCCNSDKSNRTLQEYLDILKSRHPKRKADEELNDERIKRISSILENGTVYKTNRYAAWVNSTRKYIEKELFDIFGTVECASGGRTKYNRTRLGLPKDHHYDALCVGTVPEDGYKNTNQKCLYIKANGRGSRFRGQTNKCGIIKVKYPKGPKRVFGFQTSDIVIANIPKGKYKGTYTGRIAVRSSGYFKLTTKEGEVVNAKYEYCTIRQHVDGYSYAYA